jgi:hypothetical protein
VDWQEVISGMTASVLAPPRRLSAAVWAPTETALAAMGIKAEITLGLRHADRTPAASGGSTPAASGGSREQSPADWIPASSLVEPEGMHTLLGAAARRWNAPAHAAATLAWKSYSYWAALPVVLSWVAGRRVPLLTPETTYARFQGEPPFLRIGVADVPFAVLASDPLAHLTGTLVIDSEQTLLKILRHTLLDQHLDPLLDAIRAEVNVGRRTLMGSVASGIAYALIRASDALPGSTYDSLLELLTALDLDDLVEIGQSSAGLTVQRRTCCLAFTLEEPKICSGCCIRT